MTRRAATPEEPDDPVIRPFADWLREQSKGESHEELSEGLHTLVARVRDTGKKGYLVYTVSVAPLDKEGEALAVKDEIKLKLPEHDRRGSIFYADDNGNLVRTDPNQLTFDSLREVPAFDPKTGEIKEAGNQ